VAADARTAAREANPALRKSWQDWGIPREADARWPESTKKLHADWWQARVARQKEIDASIAAKAEFEYLYDKPYSDNRTVCELSTGSCFRHNGTILQPREVPMPALTIKGVPDEVYRRLKTNAARHRRSLNSEIITCLERSLAFPERRPDETVADLQRFHRSLRGAPKLTDAFLRRAKGTGRP
jgi:plasmid stability protein